MRKATIWVVLVLVAGLLAFPAGAQAGSAEKTGVSGTMELTPLDPGEIRVTPSGVMHQWGDTARLDLLGDVEGAVTCFYQHSALSPGFDHLVFMCSLDGEVTWDGRTGPVTGRTTGLCTADVPFEFFCRGDMTLHGSGDLDGVKLRSGWSGDYPGPPFTYEGFALAPHG